MSPLPSINQHAYSKLREALSKRAYTIRELAGITGLQYRTTHRYVVRLRNDLTDEDNDLALWIVSWAPAPKYRIVKQPRSR